ncbi:MAG: hypothetical protein K9L17_01640 [Clostridiales bacterium]|nr:hypothetical protein [Clostridiales bacterium]MCF8021394.1 hypothetical protein [Clostridiales bacterium]
MKETECFIKLIPSVIVITCYTGYLALYIIITKTAELGIINATWSSASTLTIAVIFYNESVSILKILGISFILIGTAG